MPLSKHVVLSDTARRTFQSEIFSWWNTHKRDLPWRQTRDPYRIHVSEVMLQQTQVSRVLVKYEEFLALFPTVHSLAAASLGDVLRAWKNLGYNRRGMYLKQSAEQIVARYQGQYPNNEQKLRELPGLGIYTARAILVFAYEEQLAFVDTNIRKILIDTFPALSTGSDREIQAVADQMLPFGRAWEWHQALMDYGSFHAKTFAMPNISNKPKQKFEDTDRFIRGRLVDTIRDQSWEETELVSAMQTRFQKPAERIIYNLNRLMQEGLITRINGRICLP
jgi:adenine-specific DNA glycosylase